MKTMNCQTCRDEIEEARLRQRLTDEARAHLSACAPCRIFEDERHALKELLADVEQVNAPPDFEWKLRARLNSTPAMPRRGFLHFIFAPTTPALALAASFALLVAAAVAFKQVRSRSTGNSQPPQVVAVKEENTETKDKSMSVSQSTPDAKPSTPIVEQVVSKEDDSPGSKRAGARKAATLNVEKASSRSTRATDLAGTGAQVVKRDNDFESNPLIAVEVRPSSQPAKLLVGDERGATRTVSLEPVSFGAQDVLERRDAARLSSPAARGIW